jgi:hypothetical protein
MCRATSARIWLRKFLTFREYQVCWKNYVPYSDVKTMREKSKNENVPYSSLLPSYFPSTSLSAEGKVKNN